MQSHGSVMTAASLESFPSTLMRLSLSFHVFSLCYKLRSLNGLADSLAKQGLVEWILGRCFSGLCFPEYVSYTRAVVLFPLFN